MSEISKINGLRVMEMEINIFQFKNSSPMIWPGNFLIHKLWNLVEDSNFNKKFHLSTRGHPLPKTAFIFVK